MDLALDGSFKFERDYEKIDGFDRDCGFFGLLTNTVLSSGEVLSVYRQRVVLEKGFDDLKNYLDMRRLRFMVLVFWRVSCFVRLFLCLWFVSCQCCCLILCVRGF